MKSKNILNFRQKWLDFVLEFVNSDLASMRDKEKESLVWKLVAFELRGIFREEWNDIGAMPDDPRVYSEILEGARKGYGKGDREFFGKIQPNLVAELFDIQVGLREVIEKLVNLKNDKNNVPLPNAGPFLALDRTGRYDLSLQPIQYTRANSIILSLAKLINGLDGSALMKCFGCGRYFANLSKREKKFCNSSCASRSIVRSKREELKKNKKKYAAYKKAQREYQKMYRRRLKISVSG